LKVPFFQEACFPGKVRWGASVKDECIPLLPDEPSSYQEGFHEEFILEFAPCLIHHGEKVKIEVPDYMKRSPTLPTEGAKEKQVECCLLSVTLAEHTRIIISF
jgi:hypothetical protein